MRILEKPNGRREECATLANIGYHMFEVNLDGEVYEYSIPKVSEYCKAERVGNNKWRIIKGDFFRNPVERVMRQDVLVGCAWCNVDESLWEHSTYADTIRRCKEFFSIPNCDKVPTDYQTKNGFSYYVTRLGEVWNTEKMTKIKGGIDSNGYINSHLGSVCTVAIHRLVAYHFVSVSTDLVDNGLSKKNLMVNHIDGNKLNNRWDNLEWMTYKGNLAHASSTGLMHTTIDNHLLERIWQYLQAGYSDTYISKLTGISIYTVNCIRRGTSPRYRTDNYTWPKRSPATTIDDQLLEHVFKRLEEGYSNADISRETGISVSTVNAIRRRTSPRYSTDKYTWPKHSPGIRVLDKATIFSIYDEFTYTDKNSCELSRQYNVSRSFISKLRLGHCHANLACEYITSKGLDGYWQGYRHPK